MRSEDIKICNATEEEVETCARIVVEAYSPIESTKIMFPGEERIRSKLIELRKERFLNEFTSRASKESRHNVDPKSKNYPIHFYLAYKDGIPCGFLRWCLSDVPKDQEKGSAKSVIDRSVESFSKELGTDACNTEIYADLLNQSAESHIELYRGKGAHAVLHSLTVLPNYQRQGIGQQLMKKFIEQCENEGVDAYLEATREGKPLYSQFNFTSLKELNISNKFIITCMGRSIAQK